MNPPPIVSNEEWRAALEKLRAKEKAATRASDAFAAQRRRLPRVRIERDYVFEGPDGKRTFADTSFAVVSRAPIAKIEAYRKRMGWTAPWVSSFANDFNHDLGLGPEKPEPDKYQDGETFGLSVFVRDGGAVFRTYFTAGRGVETLGTVWTLLDLTPLGRQEEWEDSPEGYPQTPPYQWGRRHDEYGR